jgi:hypothetical protein
MLKRQPLSVMAGLVPAMQDFRVSKQNVDARDERGHDVERILVTRCRHRRDGLGHDVHTAMNGR